MDKDNFLDKKKSVIDNIVFRDLSYFNDKDTLVLTLIPFAFFGNDPTVYVYVRPLFSSLKTKALDSGFKVVIEDTTYLNNPQKYQSMEHLPSYALTVTINPDDATIHQQYKRRRDTKPYILQKDTTIKLR